MIETVVESIRVSLVTQHRVVILKEVSGERHLPIWIGPFEAEAIAMELQSMASARPLPYDLIKTIIGDMGGVVQQVLVTDLSQDVFYARIVIDQDGKTIEIDSRPSDAIALAVRYGGSIPIFADEAVLEEAGVLFEADEEEQEVAQFREFLDSVTPEDFAQ